MHQNKQGGRCPGCNDPFTTRSGLLQHIENNLCAGNYKRTAIHKHILEELQEESILRAQEAKDRESSVGTSGGNEDDNQSVASMTSSVARARAIAVIDLDRLADMKIEEINDEPIDIKKEWFDRERKLWCCPHPKCR